MLYPPDCNALSPRLGHLVPRTVKLAALSIVLLWIGAVNHASATYRFTTIYVPNSLQTFAQGISDGKIVGTYEDQEGNYHGFVYDGSKYTALDDPSENPTGQKFTQATGISGGQIVGYYTGGDAATHGFILSGTTYKTLDDPTANGFGTMPYGVSGNYVAGQYSTPGGGSANFLLTLSSTTYTTFQDPAGKVTGASGVTGIYGNSVIGTIRPNMNDYEGFIWDLSTNTYTTLQFPLTAKKNTPYTTPEGICGSDIVGYYYDSNDIDYHGFLLSGGKYTSINYPGSTSGTQLNGISNGCLIGMYAKPFLAVPEGLDAGTYTVLLKPTSTDSSVPQGTGYATLTVNSTGGVVFSGQLADCEAISGTGSMFADAFTLKETLSYPAVAAKGATGALCGTLVFQKLAGADFNGTLKWIKPAQTKGKFPAAIDADLNVIGSLYTPPAAGSSALPGFTNGTLAVSGAAQITQAVILTSANSFAVNAPFQDQTALTLTPATGVFKGSFLYPGQSAPTAFIGVLYQDQIIGGGFYVGPVGAGNISLSR